MASMQQGMGQHANALPYLNEVIDSKDDRQVEFAFWLFF